jgi:uncharacterized protein (TIGR03905 family)
LKNNSEFTYTPQGVCAKAIDYTITEDNKLINVSFTGGCPGNAIGLSRLLEGMDVKEASKLLEGTTCGKKATSCPDQLAKALKESPFYSR